MEHQLIEKVREHEVLFDVWSEKYRDQNVRLQAWEEIAEELQITAGAAKSSWEKLRRRFLNALARRRNRKEDDPGKQKCSWKYEEQMSFLLPFLKSRGTGNNSADGSVDDFAADLDLNDSQDADDDDDDEADENTDIEIVSVRQLETPAHRSRSFKKLKQPSPDPLKEDGASLRKRKFEERDKPASDHTMPCLDETDMFFMSMSKMTKTLPLIEQAKIKKLLSSAVLDAQISAFSSPTYSETPFPSQKARYIHNHQYSQ